MAKNPSKHLAHMEASSSTPFLDNLDFTATQKQVETLMQTVLHENMLNENKIRFIKEQLNDKRYQINPKMIITKMFEHIDNTDVTPAELPAEVE